MTEEILSVGVITSVDDYQKILANSTQCSGLEVRMDMLGEKLGLNTLRELSPSAHKKIITLRGEDEKGFSTLSATQRWQKLATWLTLADFMDFEIQSLDTELAKDIILQKGTLKLIGSYHNFESTPSIEELTKITQQGLDFGCDIIKIAVQVSSLEDLERLGQLFSLYPETTFSLMGMGELGALSRHYFISKGSVLNYGFLGDLADAVVPGQLPASLVEQLIQVYKNK